VANAPKIKKKLRSWLLKGKWEKGGNHEEMQKQKNKERTLKPILRSEGRLQGEMNNL